MENLKLEEAELDSSVQRLFGFITDHNGNSYDPYDVWTTSSGAFLRRLYYRHSYLSLPLLLPFITAERTSPHGLRKLLGVPKNRFPISEAIMVLALRNLFSKFPVEEQGSLVESRLRWLKEKSARSEKGGLGWGLPFSWRSRNHLFPAHTPFVTHTPYVAEALVVGYEFGIKHPEPIEKVGRFFNRGLKEGSHKNGGKWSSYSPIDERKVYNAAAYRGYALALLGKFLNRKQYVEKSYEFMEFVFNVQDASGEWDYADGEPFVDHLHTAMVLKNIYKWKQLVNTSEGSENLKKGYEFYRENLFYEDSVVPKPFARAPRFYLHRWDLYDVAEAIGCLNLLGEDFPESREMARKLAKKAITSYQVESGHFLQREYPFWSYKLPMMRWGQIPLLHALTSLRTTEPVHTLVVE